MPNGDPEELVGALKQQVRNAIGAFATPDIIHVASGLPKTRSGKIMRRILRKVASSEYEGLGDISTLAEPDVVQRLIDEHRQQGALDSGLGTRDSGLGMEVGALDAGALDGLKPSTDAGRTDDRCRSPSRAE